MNPPRLTPKFLVTKAIHAKVPFVMDNGDMYWSNPSRFLAGTKKVMKDADKRRVEIEAMAGDHGKFLPFAFTTMPRLLSVPAIMGIDLTEAVQESEYTCPYTGRQHWALCPVALLLKGSEIQYREAWGQHFAQDMFFDPLDRLSKLMNLIPDVSRMDLGPGYTEYCNHFDGGHGEEAVFVDLDNGDRILAVAISWFNK